MTRDIPDDIVDAEPAGGWTSGETADSVTAESSAAAAREIQEEGPDVETPSDSPAPDGAAVDATERASDPFVESAEIQQGLDPDLVTDEQADR
ncbi:MAG: hypothetical protein P0Y48_09090 [Candidatus Microbacterium phytovorans]|uniref:Uncharacterized protein n=1 Tax=Candidatus Microbacterium phytovorans TaxID=3121374 RepID=A0AAJ5VYS6_9MICO|nr:hypothetical protein [Microbacterium sp.]WEK12627.1 MAG: hypothetical protein P0Y48_09090 [Microbacterium sp.]